MLNNWQRDKRWGSIKLGTSDTTISDFGCTITALSDILGTTPDVVNERIKTVSGFAQGNLVIWAKLEEAFPGIKIKRVWSYDNADVLKNVPNVLVEVDGKPIGGFRHWVVFIGNKKLNDPWLGKERPTSDFPNPLSYCVIGGKWNKPSPVLDAQTELDKVREERDRNWKWFVGLCEVLGKPPDYNIAIEELKKLITIEDVASEKTKQLEEANKKITDLQADLEKITKEHDAVMADNQSLTEEAQNQATLIQKHEAKINDLSTGLEELKKQCQPINLSGLRKWLYELLIRGR